MIDEVCRIIIGRVKPEALNLLRTHPLETVKSQITEKILYGILLADLNLVGGREMTISLNSSMVVSHDIDNRELILEIPEKDRNYSNITVAKMIYEDLNVSKGDVFGTTIGNPNSGDELMDGLSAMNSNIAMNTMLEVIGNRYVKVNYPHGNLSMLNTSKIKLEVEYSKNIEGIDRAYYPEFGRIAVLATKMYLYNNFSNIVESAMLDNPNLSKVLSEELMKYEGFDLLYEEEMQRLAKYSTLNDDAKMNDIMNYFI